MVSEMKVLVGYDGSACSDAAVADLRRAGLPRKVQAVVVSAPEVFPPMPSSAYQSADAHAAAGMGPAVRKAHALAAQALADARQTCGAGAARVRSVFPQW